MRFILFQQAVMVIPEGMLTTPLAYVLVFVVPVWLSSVANLILSIGCLAALFRFLRLPGKQAPASIVFFLTTAIAFVLNSVAIGSASPVLSLAITMVAVMAIVATIFLSPVRVPANDQPESEAQPHGKASDEKLHALNAELQTKANALQDLNARLVQREQAITSADETILQMNRDLEQKIQERTAQLDASNRELESFTYSVSHDLRAPLRAIDGYAKILEEDYNERIDAHGRHLIDVITRNARYMGQLIDDLLEFSRSARAEVKHTTFHSDEEVRKIIGDVLATEKNRNIEIEVRTLDPCHGDINMLRQVWTNLISNAAKYTRKNPQARIEIGSRLTDHATEYYVRDNGVGFDMNYIEKLFGVFQRLHRKEEFEGTGVGLALVKRIIDRHGGSIRAEARLGEGAVFHFTIPLADPQKI